MTRNRQEVTHGGTLKSSFSRILVLALMSFCLAAPAFAAGKAKSKPAKTKVAVEVPFDDTVERLPAKYRGNNLITIYAALAKIEHKYGKSEFETTEAFQERLAQLDDALLTGKLTYSSPIAVPLLTTIESTYDADNSTMTVSIPLTSIHDSDLSEGVGYELPPGVGAYSYSSETLDGHAIEVFTTLSQTKKFTGSNAFGMKLKITGKVYDTFAIAVRNDGKLLKYGGNATLSIPMTAAKALDAKITGNVLLVGELLHPYVGKGISHDTATIDNPVETLDRIRYVAMKLTSIWYYSMKSGEVYHKELISYRDEDTE